MAETTTSAVNAHEQKAERLPSERVTTFKSRLGAAVINYYLGYNRLKNDGISQFLRNSSDNPTERLDGIAGDFLTLRQAQLQELGEMTDILGVPLSPVGIVTFTSGRQDEMSIQLGMPFGDDIGGHYLGPENFTEGPCTNIGFWTVHTATAADDTLAQLQKFDEQVLASGDKYGPGLDENGGEIYYSSPSLKFDPRRFTPTKNDIRLQHDWINHEAFHAIHHSINREIESVKEPDRKILKELLAYRTSLIKGLRTVEQVQNNLLNHYLDPEEKTEGNIKKIEAVLKIISASYEASYQSDLTWRGLLANSLDEFLDPDEQTLRDAQELSEYAKKVAIPRYKESFGLK